MTLANGLPAADYHVHTYHSPCWHGEPGVGPLEELACAAEMGLEVVGFSDHFVQRPELAYPEFKPGGPEIIAALRVELAANHTGVRTLVGCEADLATLDRLNIDPGYARELDYVMVAASHFHIAGVSQPPSREPRVVAEHYLAFMRRALSFELAAIIAHPFYASGDRLGPPDTYLDQMTDDELREVAELARRNRTAMEISRDQMARPRYREPMRRFIRICREEGVRFTLGSDAHSLARLRGAGDGAAGVASLGLRPEDFLSADELVARGKQRGGQS